MTPDAELDLATPTPIDVPRTLKILGYGPRDPTIDVQPSGVVLRAMNTPEGAATLEARGGQRGVRVRIWGPGTAHVADRVEDLLGLRDDPTRLVPLDRVVRALHHRFGGLRLGTGSGILDLLVPTIVHQRVTSLEAHRSWRRLVTACGDPAPGPVSLRVPPRPDQLRRIPAWSFHRFGIERKRAETILEACRLASKLESTAELPPEEAALLLCRVRGIGPWTAAMTLAKACGWPDAVPLGDYNLPAAVAWRLAGERRADDARMMELLEPYVGQRWRVIRLIRLAGGKPPRRAPRAPLRRD